MERKGTRLLKIGELAQLMGVEGLATHSSGCHQERHQQDAHDSKMFRRKQHIIFSFAGNLACAGGGTRTHTRLPSPDFESGIEGHRTLISIEETSIGIRLSVFALSARYQSISSNVVPIAATTARSVSSIRLLRTGPVVVKSSLSPIPAFCDTLGRTRTCDLLIRSEAFRPSVKSRPVWSRLCEFCSLTM